MKSPTTHQNKEKKLTEEQEIIMGAWYQFAYITKRGRWSGGLSALEDIEWYLRSKGLINSLGNKIK